MLSCFHLILERDGQTDRQMDRIAISISRISLLTRDKNYLKILSHLTKTETSPVVWLSIVTIVARNVRLLPILMREDAQATNQFHCQWWFGQWLNALPNIQQTLLQFIVVVHRLATTDRLAARRRFIFCGWQGWGQDCVVATNPVEWKQALPAQEVVQCQICQNSNF